MTKVEDPTDKAQEPLDEQTGEDKPTAATADNTLPHAHRLSPAAPGGDLSTMSNEEVAAAAGLDEAGATELQQEAQDEVLSELKGERLKRQASAGEEPHPPKRHEGALGEYTAVVAEERNETPAKVLDDTPAADVDLQALDGADGDSPTPRYNTRSRAGKD